MGRCSSTSGILVLLIEFLVSSSAMCKWCHNYTKRLHLGQWYLEQIDVSPTNSRAVEDCTWDLTVPEAARLSVKVNQIKLPEGGSPEWDINGMHVNREYGKLYIFSDTCDSSRFHAKITEGGKSNFIFKSSRLCFKYTSTNTNNNLIPSQTLILKLNITVISNVCRRTHHYVHTAVSNGNTKDCAVICNLDGTKRSNCTETRYTTKPSPPKSIDTSIKIASMSTTKTPTYTSIYIPSTSLTTQIQNSSKPVTIHSSLFASSSSKYKTPPLTKTTDISINTTSPTTVKGKQTFSFATKYTTSQENYKTTNVLPGLIDLRTSFSNDLSRLQKTSKQMRRTSISSSYVATKMTSTSQAVSFITARVTWSSSSNTVIPLTNNSSTKVPNQDLVGNSKENIFYVVSGVLSALLLICISGCILFVVYKTKKDKTCIGHTGSFTPDDNDSYWRHNWTMEGSSPTLISSPHRKAFKRQLSLPPTSMCSLYSQVTRPYRKRPVSESSLPDSATEEDCAYDNVQNLRCNTRFTSNEEDDERLEINHLVDSIQRPTSAVSTTCSTSNASSQTHSE